MWERGARQGEMEQSCKVHPAAAAHTGWGLWVGKVPPAPERGASGVGVQPGIGCSDFRPGQLQREPN